MKNWKLFCSVFVSLLLVAKPTEISRACGWFDEDTFFDYSFFDPASSLQQDYSPLFLSFNRFYDHSWQSDAFVQRDNLAEWADYFKGDATSEDIAAVVYRWPVDVLYDIKPWVDSKGSAPHDSLQRNSLVQVWKKKKWSVPICYLEFAKRCEPQVAAPADPWEEVQRDIPAMMQLIEEGEARIGETRDDFISLRYAFQVVRLAHYAGMYEDCLALFDALVLPLRDKVQSQFYWWALGHRAGALRALGRQAEANYDYMQVFTHCPAKRVQAWLSFRVTDDAAWQALLAQCKTPDERVTLHLMRGIDYYAKTTEEMKAIYAIDPTAPALDLLLAREINKLEADLLNLDFDFSAPFPQTYEARHQQEALAYRGVLQRFVQKALADGKVRRPAYWRAAHAWLSYLEGDYAAAATTLDQARSINREPQLRQQLDLLGWAVEVSRTQRVSLAAETRLFDALPPARDDDPHQLHEKALSFLLNRMEPLLLANGETGKAYLCRRDYTALCYDPQPAVVDDLLRWLDALDQRTPSSLERHLRTRLGGDDARARLREMQATLAMRSGNWEQAVALYDQVSPTARQAVVTFDLPADPFVAFEQDCINCYDSANPLGDRYTRQSLAAKLLQLEMQVRRDSSPETLLALGTATYNMTYFGHAWQATAYARSGSDFGGATAVQDMRNLLARAEAYFDAAARRALNREQAARAHFLSAKCAQNRYYLDGHGDYDSDAVQEIKPTYRLAFDRLSRDYADTDYYRSARAGCAYLDTYASMRGR
ncbi:MAG: hypothetical protein OHK0039_27950 [Bacteroidia bacterium]